MAKKAEVNVIFRIKDLDISVRFLGRVARLGEPGIKSNWAYDVSFATSKKGFLFKGADLYTPDYFSHGMAAAMLMGYHFPVDGGVPEWFSAENLSHKQAQWFLGMHKEYAHVKGVTNLTSLPDVFLVREDGSLVAFLDGVPDDDATLGEVSEGTTQLAEAQARQEDSA